MKIRKQKILSKIISAVYLQMIVKKKQEIMFWVLYSFLMTFILSRLIVNFFPNLFISVSGTHIHHFAYGIILLSISGLASINNLHKKYPRLIAVIYGIGLGMAIDEFGMWIHLTDDYWIRRSYDAIIAVGGFLFSIVYFGRFWNAVIRKTKNFFITGIRRGFLIKKILQS